MRARKEGTRETRTNTFKRKIKTTKKEINRNLIKLRKSKNHKPRGHRSKTTQNRNYDENNRKTRSIRSPSSWLLFFLWKSCVHLHPLDWCPTGDLRRDWNVAVLSWSILGAALIMAKIKISFFPSLQITPRMTWHWPPSSLSAVYRWLDSGWTPQAAVPRNTSFQD